MSVSRSRSDSDALGGVAGGYAPLDSGLLVPSSYVVQEADITPSTTYIAQDAATTNYSNGGDVRLADRVSAPGGYFKSILASFDLSSLSGKTILRADFHLYQIAGGGNAGIFTGHIGVRKVVRSGVVLSQATYNVYATGSNWGQAGARDPTDTAQLFDYTTMWSSPSNEATGWRHFDLARSVIRALADSESSLMVQVCTIDVNTGSQNPLLFASEDHGTASLRPFLRVTYL